jgi:hypothetical protein
MITYNALGYVGKLGNQMFQYACLLGIASKNNYEIAIPYRNTEWMTNRSYDTRLYLLDIFDISAKDLGDKSQFSYSVLDESSEFKPKLLSIPDDTNIFGYFQSEKYFSHCKDIVKKEFTFKNKDLYSKCKNLLNSFSANPKVALHIRRGDYVNLSAIHSLCSIDYYLQGIDYIKNKLNTKFDLVIFSDDIPWCKEKLNYLEKDYTLIYDEETSSEKTYYEHQEQSLMFMTLCDHFVIANSSFSWWGSWLSNNLNKITIAPKQWYGHKEFNEYKDIYCDDWILI